MRIVYRKSNHLEDFRPIIAGLSSDLGDRFPTSIENWCGVGSRPYPLPVWEIFLAYQEDQPIGICSYYKQQEDSANQMWIGWIGVLKDYRRNRIGSQMLNWIEDRILAAGCTDVWVYVEPGQDDTIQFYQSNGYQLQALFETIGRTQAAAKNSSPVLRKQLSP